MKRLKEIESKKRIRKSEKRYRDLVDTITYGIKEVDLKGRLVFLNDAYHHMLGYELGELVGTYIWDHYPTVESQKRITNYFEYIKRERPNPEPYISQNLRRDGKVIDVCIEWNYQFADSGELTGFISVVTDITDKAKSEQALKKNEALFRSFVENANDIVYTISSDGKFTYVSPNWLEFFGQPAEVAIGSHYKNYVHPEDIQVCRDFLNEVLTTGEKREHVEYRLRHKDGAWHWHVSNGSPLSDSEGIITGFLGISRDVTESKLVEQALKQSEKRYREHFSQFPIPTFVWTKDAKGFFLSNYNLAAEDITGGKAESIKGVYADQLYASPDSRHLLGSINKCFQSHKTIQKEFEYSLVTTGQKKWVKAT